MRQLFTLTNTTKVGYNMDKLNIQDMRGKCFLNFLLPSQTKIRYVKPEQVITQKKPSTRDAWLLLKSIATVSAGINYSLVTINLSQQHSFCKSNLQKGVDMLCTFFVLILPQRMALSCMPKIMVKERSASGLVPDRNR